jgi:hypothetical protein
VRRLDAAAQGSAAARIAVAPAHQGADPIQLVEADLIEQRFGKRGVKIVAIFLLRLRAPLTQAAANRVRHDDMIFAREFLRDVIKIAAGARKAMPHDQRFCPALAPLHVMDLAIEQRDIARARNIHAFVAPWRSRPTIPLGKNRTLKINRMPSHKSQRSGWNSPGTSGTPALAAAFETLPISACR